MIEMTRRNFLKKGIIVTAAAAVGAEAKHEVILAREGDLETRDAVWHPIYERHDRHVEILQPNNIPAGLDALSLEGNLWEFVRREPGDSVMSKISYLDIPIPGLFVGGLSGYDTIPPNESTRFPPATLDYLREKGIPVAFGDIDSGLSDGRDELFAENLREFRIRFGELLLGAGAVTSAAGLKTEKIGRRQFLKLLGASGLALAGVMAIPAQFRPEIHKMVMDSFDESYERRRITARLMTISNNLQPERINDLFRELIQANKLMTLAKELNTGEGKPYIGYNWHLGHRGIEDWLRLGQEFTRNVILAFPDDVLKRVIAINNNDPRSLFAIRLTDVPKSLTIGKTTEAVTEYYFDGNEVVEDRIIEDKILADKLKKIR